MYCGLYVHTPRDRGDDIPDQEHRGDRQQCRGHAPRPAVDAPTEHLQRSGDQQAGAEHHQVLPAIHPSRPSRTERRHAQALPIPLTADRSRRAFTHRHALAEDLEVDVLDAVEDLRVQRQRRRDARPRRGRQRARYPAGLLVDPRGRRRAARPAPRAPAHRCAGAPGTTSAGRGRRRARRVRRRAGRPGRGPGPRRRRAGSW